MAKKVSPPSVHRYEMKLWSSNVKHCEKCNEAVMSVIINDLEPYKTAIAKMCLKCGQIWALSYKAAPTPEVKKAIHADIELSPKLISFGYKNGIPNNINTVYDLRKYNNPFSIKELRPLDGRDEAVQQWMLRCSLFQQQVEYIVQHLNAYPYMPIGVGCQSGVHRSAALVEIVKKRLGPEKCPPIIHRDLDKRRK
jgi:RNase adaptor protein for sRNA GlmZ degradation